MGIVVKGKEVVAIYYGKIAVEAVYKGARPVAVSEKDIG